MIRSWFKNTMCFLLLFLLCEQRLVVHGEDSDHVLLMTEHVANRKEMFLVDSGNDKWASPQIRLVLKTKESTYFFLPTLHSRSPYLTLFLSCIPLYILADTLYKGEARRKVTIKERQAKRVRRQALIMWLNSKTRMNTKTTKPNKLKQPRVGLTKYRQKTIKRTTGSTQIESIARHPVWRN